MAKQIKKVGVLGAGLMGHGITQVAAQSGYEVVVRASAVPRRPAGMTRQRGYRCSTSLRPLLRVIGGPPLGLGS